MEGCDGFFTGFKSLPKNLTTTGESTNIDLSGKPSDKSLTTI